MPNPHEPKKETVHIALPPQLAAEPPGGDTKSRDEAPQFVPPSSPFPVSSPSSPPAPAPPPAPVSPAPDSRPPGLKKETARISFMPDPVARPAPPAQRKTAQRRIATPITALEIVDGAIGATQHASAEPFSVCATVHV